MSTLEEIYEFLNLDFGERERNYAFQLTHKGEKALLPPNKLGGKQVKKKVKSKYYFSTERKSDFRHDSWKNKLSSEVNNNK